MSVRKAAEFIADAELQYQWYAENAGWEVAERYLAAVAATCALIEREPMLGPVARLTDPRLATWRFFVVLRPFHRHILFYELVGGDVILRRALHGHRHLTRRILEPPGAD